MKRAIWMGLVLLLSLVAFSPAWGLTDEEYRQLLAQSQEFREADEGLRGAWEEAKEKLTPGEFRRLGEVQRAWLREGRDVGAGRRIREGVPKAKAYADATMDQVVLINGEISRSFLRKNPKGAQGLYVLSRKGVSGVLEVYGTDDKGRELFVALEAKVRDGKGAARTVSFQGRGVLANGRASVVSDSIPKRELTLLFSGREVTVVTGPAFRDGGGVVPDGVYVR